ncbi:hypothetical protein CRG98_028954 [Punica granatum]|uniref:Uncharacterized protein n=1 Tax=Punica granatum TaxID=22663 RepID=A0A2I0J350_PUNGR|nr:hypothetical protein CRG98_028954 [Punica granatum]
MEMVRGGNVLKPIRKSHAGSVNISKLRSQPNRWVEALANGPDPTSDVVDTLSGCQRPHRWARGCQHPPRMLVN